VKPQPKLELLKTMAEKLGKINTKIAKRQDKLSFHMKKMDVGTIGRLFDKEFRG